MTCDNEKVFEFGERRRVTMKVWLNDGTSFTPANCKYQLMLGPTVEAEGSCETEQDGTAWNLTCEVQPKQRRAYTLTYTFELGTEIIKRSVGIRVVSHECH